MDQHDLFARHGGVHFTNHASPDEINLFISRLPAGKRESLFEVLSELNKEGLITIYNDHVWTDGEGKLGGSDEC
ncbi:MAG: hypothetical protein H0Z33_09255 [Bacillaceae bacterium]|nr:hypothetical protein [Bacillaceae bacterium]